MEFCCLQEIMVVFDVSLEALYEVLQLFTAKGFDTAENGLSNACGGREDTSAHDGRNLCPPILVESFRIEVFGAVDATHIASAKQLDCTEHMETLVRSSLSNCEPHTNFGIRVGNTVIMPGCVAFCSL